jgi:hypothetical protein
MILGSTGQAMYWRDMQPSKIQRVAIIFSSYILCCAFQTQHRMTMSCHQKIPYGTVGPCWNTSKRIDIATPTGPSALDEHSTATKARTVAKTYNAHKPAKFAVCFYAVRGRSIHVHQVFLTIVLETKWVYVAL